MIEVKINGLFLTQSQASGVILKEKNGERTLPIIIGEYEAQSIALGLEKIKPPRPITHDLTLKILSEIGAEISRIVVTELKDNTYYALIVLTHLGQTHEIESRPSDAIALAVRDEIPIFIADEVLLQGSYSEEELEDTEKSDGAEEKKVEVKQEYLEKLEKDLAEAVAQEEYEKAAQIRDEINKFKSLQ